MKFETAEEVAAITLQTFEALNEMLWKIKEGASEEEFVHYRRAVAHAIGNLDYEVLAKIYREYPELEKRDVGLHPPEVS